MNGHLTDDELIDNAYGLCEDAADAAHRAQHLAACPACLARQAGLRARLDQLSLLQTPIEAPEPLITDTLRRIRLADPAPAARPWTRWLILAGSAAAAAVALIGFPLLSRLGAHALDPAPTPAETTEGFVVALSPDAPPLDDVAPLPDSPPARPPVLGAAEELAALGDHRTPAVPGAAPDAALPGPTAVTADTHVALQRVDARQRARHDAAALAAGTASPGNPVARAPAAGRPRDVRLPAAAGMSPGPAVILYAIAERDFSGPIGAGQEIAVEQRAGRIVLSNRAPRALTVRVLAAEGTYRDVFLAPAARTNLAVRAGSER